MTKSWNKIIIDNGNCVANVPKQTHNCTHWKKMPWKIAMVHSRMFYSNWHRIVCVSTHIAIITTWLIAIVHASSLPPQKRTHTQKNNGNNNGIHSLNASNATHMTWLEKTNKIQEGMKCASKNVATLVPFLFIGKQMCAVCCRQRYNTRCITPHLKFEMLLCVRDCFFDFFLALSPSSSCSSAKWFIIIIKPVCYWIV